MSIPFPTSPTINQTYKHPSSNKTFKWDGIKWTRIIKKLDTSPLLPNTGGTLTGNLYGLPRPSTNSSAADKAYVDTIARLKITSKQMDDRVRAVGNPKFLYVSGTRTMTGNLTTARLNMFHLPSKYTSHKISFKNNWHQSWCHAHHTPGQYVGVDWGYDNTVVMSTRISPSPYVWTLGPRRLNSDIRNKKNIISITNGITKTKNIKAYTYQFKDTETEKSITENKTKIGVIAQHVQKVFPIATSQTQFDEDTSKLVIDTGALAALTLATIKEIDSKLAQIKENSKKPEL